MKDKSCLKCKRVYNEEEEDDFIRFPIDEEDRRKIAEILKLEINARITSQDIVCASHFEETVIGDGEEISIHEEYLLEMKEDPEGGSSNTLANIVQEATALDTEVLETEEHLLQEQEEGEIAQPPNIRILNGLAVFSCNVCPALFLNKIDFDDHMALRGSAWNTKAHSDHRNGVVSALRTLARNPTNGELVEDDNKPSVKKKTPDHTYATPKKRGRKRNAERKEVNRAEVKTEEKPLPEKLFPGLVPQKYRKKLANKKQWRDVRRHAFEAMITELWEQVDEKEKTKPDTYNLLPKPGGLLRVLKDGRIMREHSFIT